MKKTKIQNITILGSGNLAHHLALELQKRELRIHQIFSRKEEHARALASLLDVSYSTKISDLEIVSDLYILAISDDALEEVCQALSKILPQDSFLAHTSGATPSSIFANYFNNYGVFYPLQSFSKAQAVDFAHIPICVDASQTHLLKLLYQLAQKISTKVYKINDEQRAYLHVAAVFANNFSNYLFHVAYELSQEHQIPFDLLRPLILESAQKVQYFPPAQMQTGPAIREDEITMQRHLELLKSHPNWRKLYEDLSAAIQRMKP